MDKNTFREDNKTKDAVVLQFEITDEAAKSVSEDIRFLSPEIDWKDITDIRDRLICTYSDLEKILISDFEIGNDFQQEDLEGKILESKNEIYWVYKYLKLIQFIQSGSEGLISISLKGKDFLSKYQPEVTQLENIDHFVSIKDYFVSF